MQSPAEKSVLPLLSFRPWCSAQRIKIAMLAGGKHTATYYAEWRNPSSLGYYGFFDSRWSLRMTYKHCHFDQAASSLLLEEKVAKISDFCRMRCHFDQGFAWQSRVEKSVLPHNLSVCHIICPTVGFVKKKSCFFGGKKCLVPLTPEGKYGIFFLYIRQCFFVYYTAVQTV